MSAPRKICVDLKTERGDILPALPGILRLLPLAFYFSVAASLLLTSFFLLQLRSAKQAKERFIAEEQSETRLNADLEGVYNELKAESKKAEDVVEWVEGTRGLQDLCLTVTRSMEPGSTIVELSFERERDNPGQIQFGLKLNGSKGGTSSQLEKTLARLEEAKFRKYNAAQSNSKDTTQYNAVIIHQE